MFTDGFLNFFFLFHKVCHEERLKDCHQGVSLESLNSPVSQKQQNTSLSKAIAAKINSLQAVGISIDNKLDKLDARVST